MQDLVSKGAVAANSPAEVGSKAQIIITMLPSPKIVDEVPCCMGGMG